MLPLSKTQKFTKSWNVYQCLALNLLENGSASFAIDHSLYSGMNGILQKGQILRRCQRPYQYRRPTCWIRVSPYLFQTFHQISSLEKTTCRHCSILRGLMSLPAIRVSPHLFAAHLTTSEVDESKCLDIPIWEFSELWSIFHFDLGRSRYCVRCLSCASWQSGDDIHDLFCRHL